MGSTGSSNGDFSLARSEGLKAARGRGCLRLSLRLSSLGARSAVGEGGAEDSVERAANQGYSLTVSFQMLPFGSDA
jgi:hypothetical protein